MTQSGTRRLWLLGPARVDQIHNALNKDICNISDQVPRFRSQRTVAILGYLVAEQRHVARDHLAMLFWPDEQPSKGRANLSRELHNLAQILPGCWELDRRSVAFLPTSGTTVDLYELSELMSAENWREAVELLGGEFLEGLYLDNNPEFEYWLLGERERWRERAEVVFKHLSELHALRGQYGEALKYSSRLLQLAPWNEDAHRETIRLLAWSGQRGAALRQYDSCKRALREELDVDPSPETIKLYKQIQAGKLDLPPQLPAFLTDEKARRPFESPPFVGREATLEKLETFIDAAHDGQSRVVFITGGPGRGKTALLNAISQRAMALHPDLLVLNGYCNAYSGLGDPYLPYRDVMAMLTGDIEGRWDAGAISRDHARRLWAAFSSFVQILLTHGSNLLDVLVPGQTLLSRCIAAGYDDAPWFPRLREIVTRQPRSIKEVEQSHLFQQVTNVLLTIASTQPLLLILDDVQWADNASISLLFHLGRRIVDSDSKLLIVCAYRPEELALGRAGKRHPLVQVVSEFRRTFGEVSIELGKAEEHEARRFVNDLVDTEDNRLSQSFRVSMFNRTGGHPLFTLELLRAMRERGNLIQDEDLAWIEGPTLDWEVLPARVEAVIQERVDRLDPNLQEILTIASVEGEVFTADVVAYVQKTSERSILHQLSQELERRHRLVREQEEIETTQRRMSSYRFGHILYQEYLYKRLSKGERRLLHGEVAKALEVLYEDQLEEMAVQMAQHFYKAGDYEQAFFYNTMAGQRATHIYASGEAITHYTRAIQLADRIATDGIFLARLHHERGLANGTVGDFEKASTDHNAALQIAQAAGDRQIEWQAMLELGRLWAARNHNQARDYFETALELARNLDDPASLASSLNWMGNWAANNETPLTAIKYHYEALSLFKKMGNARDIANTLDLLGLANIMGCNFTASVRYYDRAIEISRELDDRPRLASSLIGRATTVAALVFLTSLSATSPPDAITDLCKARRIAREVDSASDEIWSHWSLGLLYILHGQFGTALEELQIGLRIATEIGHREWVVGNNWALGLLYSELYAPGEALKHLEEAITLAGEHHSPVWINDISGALAKTYFLLDDFEGARSCLDKVIPTGTPMDALGKRYCWVCRAELALAQGESDLALDIINRLIDSTPGMSPGRVVPYLWSLKGNALAACGHDEDARAHLISALDNAQNNEERFLLWRIHGDVGQLLFTVGDHTKAEQAISTARALIDEMAETLPDRTLKNNFRGGAYKTLKTAN